MDNNRKNQCPSCNYKFITLENDYIVCLRCDWKVISKRKDDGKLRENFVEKAKEFNG